MNLGSGDDRREGYVNVDLRADVADVVAHVHRLPFADSSILEILANDILEHFPQDSFQEVLREWRRVLKPGGFLQLRVPNIQHLARLIDLHHSDVFIYTLIENLYGAHRWGPGGSLDAHHWGWSPWSLHRDLVYVGFDVLTFDDEPNFTTLAARR